MEIVYEDNQLIIVNKACGETRDGFHVLVGGYSRRFVCVRCIFLHFCGRILKKRINAAHELLVVSKG